MISDSNAIWTLPGVLSWETSGTTTRAPVKSQRSPAWAVSTASALRMISRERGIEPRGSSAWVSWIRTWPHTIRTGIRNLRLTCHLHNIAITHASEYTCKSPQSYLLEVNKLGFVCVKVEARAVVAGRVPADGWRGVFELLRDIFDDCLAVHAQEGAAHL